MKSRYFTNPVVNSGVSTMQDSDAKQFHSGLAVEDDDNIWDDGDDGWDLKHDWERGFEMGAELASDELCLSAEDD